MSVFEDAIANFTDPNREPNALYPIMWSCGFAQGALAIIGGTMPDDAQCWLVLCLIVASVIMLGMVLGTYWLMFSKYPGFLTATGRNAVILGKVRMILEKAPEGTLTTELLKDLIRSDFAVEINDDNLEI